MATHNIPSADMIISARRGVPITASANIFPACRAIHCNTTGTITVAFEDDPNTTVDLYVIAGMEYARCLVKVTVGTGVVALY